MDQAIEAMWPDIQPRDPAAALQTHLFRLRRSLPAGVISSVGDGYRLDPSFVDVDADRLAAALASADSDPSATSSIDDVARWRGPAFPELADLDEGRVAAMRLDELRIRAIEAGAAAELHTGRHEEAIVRLRALADEQPLRERPRALLMAALAEVGRRVEALRVYDDFRRLVGDELGIEPSAALIEQHAELVRGGPTSPIAPSRLPVALTSLIGRDELVETAAGMAATGRLVTLVGTAGVGKTRLLLEVGHALATARPDRPVVWCELATATPDSVITAIASTMRIEGRTGTTLEERVATMIAEAEIVLLLDNCEHVLDVVAELVERLLGRCPGLRVLCTSRERLRVSGEQLCPVVPLPFSDEESAAERLFVERARAVAPDFDPDETATACIREIVRRLDGLPLAIELAAARLHTMDVGAIASGLDQRFRLLSSGSRTSSRHRSLGAALAWSFGMLDREAQRVFCNLSVFNGSFSVGDVAAVSAMSCDEAAGVLDQLAERSLVSRAGGRRFVLLETMRAFGAEQLAVDARTDEVADRHAERAVERIEQAHRMLAVADGVNVLGEIDAGLPELRAALDWLLAHGDLDRAARLVVALQYFGYHRLRPEALSWAERIVAADPHDEHPLAPEVWSVAALAAWMAGDLDEQRRRVERALAIVDRRGIETPSLVAMTASSAALVEGRLEEAVRWSERSIALASDDLGPVVIAHNIRVLALAYDRDPSAAAAADELLRLVGPARTALAAFAWYCAGEALLREDPAQARRRFARALELAELTGSTFAAGIAGASDASLEARFGDPDVAAAEFRRLLTHWRRAGMWSTQWTMLRSVAAVLATLGRPREAAVLLGAVLDTDAGHRLFGDDVIALAELGNRLRAELGDDVYDAAIAEGGALDGDAAVEHALRSL